MDRRDGGDPTRPGWKRRSATGGGRGDHEAAVRDRVGDDSLLQQAVEEQPATPRAGAPEAEGELVEVGVEVYVGEFLPVSSLHAPSLLHPEPLPRARLVDFDQLGENIREQRLALGVVAAPAYGNRSVVFHQGGIPQHRENPLRGIEYVATPELGLEHIPRC
jgi:hypothetical protein